MLVRNKTRRILHALSKNTIQKHENHMDTQVKRYCYSLPDLINQKKLEQKRRLEIKADLKLKHQIKGKRNLLCKELKKARIAKGLSQMELAFHMGCDQNYISKLENGKVNVSLDMLLKVSYHLDCWLQLIEQRKQRGEQAPPADCGNYIL